jgi:hypothetical protein
MQFGATIDSPDSFFSKSRAVAHKQFDSSISQISYVANCISNCITLLQSHTPTSSTFSIAVVFPDIQPLEGEFAGKQLLSLLFRLDIVQPKNVLLISTRTSIKTILGDGFKECAVSDRIDETLASHSLIVFTSSSLYLGLSIEPIRAIEFNSGTILMSTNTTLSTSKIQQMFSPNTVIPFFPSESIACEYKDQGSTWNSKEMRPGFVLPDLGMLE